MTAVYVLLALHVLLIWSLCRAAARGDAYQPTHRQLRQWKRERLELSVNRRRPS